jgi:hypothetical protein
MDAVGLWLCCPRRGVPAPELLIGHCLQPQPAHAWHDKGMVHSSRQRTQISRSPAPGRHGFVLVQLAA